MWWVLMRTTVPVVEVPVMISWVSAPKRLPFLLPLRFGGSSSLGTMLTSNASSQVMALSRPVAASKRDRDGLRGLRWPAGASSLSLKSSMVHTSLSGVCSPTLGIGDAVPATENTSGSFVARPASKSSPVTHVSPYSAATSSRSQICFSSASEV